LRVFPNYQQKDQKYCGPTCLKIVAKHYKQTIPIQKLRDLSETSRVGGSMMGLSDASEAIGFMTIGVKMTFEVLKRETPLPCIVHWNKNHFAVVYKIKRGKIYISDPAIGLLKYTKQELLARWIGNNADDKTQEGVDLLLEPTPKLYQDTYEEEKGYGIQFVSKYLF
jgi:ATP-binding cassette subfamily B protein